MMGNRSSTAIQAVYELCKKTFTSNTSLGSALAVQKVRSLLGTNALSHYTCLPALRNHENGPRFFMDFSEQWYHANKIFDSVTPLDVGLREDFSDDERGLGYGSDLFRNRHAARAARWTPPITYLHIHECNNFTIGIFCLPTSSVIPLHDHPGMTVLSKILYGSMHVKAYDWVEPACVRKSIDSQVRLAKLKMDTVLTAPCETAALFPKTGGNIHCFTAVTSCAVLDVLAPPYSEHEGRNCTYYHDHPYSTFGGGVEIDESEENYAWLEEVAAPDDFYVLPGKYTGPVVRA